MNFVESFQSYKGVIQADDLNLVDYVESDEPYKIPHILAGIQRSLKTGVAVVALQKNNGNEYAYGGYETIAKPAVFCALENSTCKVVKAKNWASDHINPNGFQAKFKIYAGINLSRVGGWEAP